jgi:hypothetical protein
MALSSIPEEELRGLTGNDYTHYFNVDLDFSKLTPKEAMFMTRYLDITKKYFKEYLKTERTVTDETAEATRRRSELREVYNAITMKGGKRTRMKRKGKRTRRNYR